MLSFWEGRVCPFFIKIHFFVMTEKRVESVGKRAWEIKMSVEKT